MITVSEGLSIGLNPPMEPPLSSPPPPGMKNVYKSGRTDTGIDE